MRYLFPLNPYNQQRQFEKPVWVYPAHLAMYATYLRNSGHKVYWLKENDLDREVLERKTHPEDFEIIKDDTQIEIPFENLPFPDRVFTDAKNPRWQKYGNYKFHPATHMMSSNLCWWGRCTFCIDTEKLKTEKRGVRSVDHVLEEIDDLIRLGFKEVFDDAGTVPIGEWLEELCLKMIKSGRNKKIILGCNLKPIEEKVVPFKLMKAAGFRFILIGMESANQETINKIHKGQNSAKVIENIKAMSDASLETHGTFMTGYPWETEKDEKRTIELCHFLLKKGYLKTAQASVYSPPRTAPDPRSPGNKYLPRFFDVFTSPEFLIKKSTDIKCWEDFTYLLRGPRLMIAERWRKFCLTRSR